MLYFSLPLALRSFFLALSLSLSFSLSPSPSLPDSNKHRSVYGLTRSSTPLLPPHPLLPQPQPRSPDISSDG
ncbi:hypothetical protein XA68_18185 [Ophiocordyceps unilateralis]|uniref:Secreted protein n=1 Tax=Ophiocordyceps unilateralis TaxID=268505 RepID=A0A2A9PJA9_OPHUN|nr:hypothetical protein XA68_18185 [Ophiocordyceps unilateralis]